MGSLGSGKLGFVVFVCVFPTKRNYVPLYIEEGALVGIKPTVVNEWWQVWGCYFYF